MLTERLNQVMQFGLAIVRVINVFLLVPQFPINVSHWLFLSGAGVPSQLFAESAKVSERSPLFPWHGIQVDGENFLLSY